MSFRNTRNSKVPARRSSSLRNTRNTGNTVPGLASYNRPRSTSFLEPSKTYNNMYNSNYTTYSTPSLQQYSLSAKTLPYNSYNSSPYNSSKNLLNYNSYMPLSLNSNYGGLSNGYGAVAVTMNTPSKNLTALNIMPYSSSSSYDKSNLDYKTNISNSEKRKGRSMSRNGSFARSRSASAIRDSNMGSRSISMSSINSEGYIVR